jgi:putative iron-dependent peroxidase
LPKPQPGILADPGPHAVFLVLRVPELAAAAASVGQALASVPERTARTAKADPRAGLACTVGIGPELWDALSPGKRPLALRPFRAIDGGRLSAPATGGDVLLHLSSRRCDLAFELTRQLMAALGGAARVMEEVHGFRYLDNRDLTGFIDGTENPKGKERPAAALIGREDPPFVAGSYVFTQRYVHDLARWATLSVEEQEGAIGRRKRDSKELSAARKPATAHISRVVIEQDGEELEILRHSMPYGTVSEAGLFFIAYTRDLGIPERMLARMYGTSGDGLHDRLMEFTRAVSGANFFAPSLKVLKRLAAP